MDGASSRISAFMAGHQAGSLFGEVHPARQIWPSEPAPPVPRHRSFAADGEDSFGHGTSPTGHRWSKLALWRTTMFWPSAGLARGGLPVDPRVGRALMASPIHQDAHADIRPTKTQSDLMFVRLLACTGGAALWLRQTEGSLPAQDGHKQRSAGFSSTAFTHSQANDPPVIDGRSGGQFGDGRRFFETCRLARCCTSANPAICHPVLLVARRCRPSFGHPLAARDPHTAAGPNPPCTSPTPGHNARARRPAAYGAFNWTTTSTT